MESERDQMFLEILREEKNITNFLDAFFGFLYRCTDFFIESSLEEKIGFPPGVAEKLVLGTLSKWKGARLLSNRLSSHEDYEEQNKRLSYENEEDLNVPDVSQEIQVKTSEKCDVDDVKQVELNAKEQSMSVQSSDHYNGAIRENYIWSQTISDVDVIVKIPVSLKSAKDVRLNVQSNRIRVEARTCVPSKNQATEACSNNSEWSTIFDGELSYNIRKDEAIWSMVPGLHISIHLEKAAERWWEALIKDEPKIELNKIDCSRNLDDMGPTEQMKVQELMWNHQQRILGKPTSEQIKMEKILKQAWDANGSPFKGTPYDASILKFS